MRKTFALTLILLTTASAATVHAGSSPEEMIQRYFEAFKVGDMALVAANMHEGELAKFQQALLPVIEKSIESSPGGPGRDELAIRMFTNRDDIETIRAEKPAAFFERFMRWVIKLNPSMLEAMSKATIETLGFVPEKDMAHAVYRIHIDMMGAKVTQLNVMSLKKQGEEWRLMMTGEIEGMGKLLQMNMNQP